MGVFAQVGLLLWKNTKLRIRSPLLTATTLFWPIVIFIIIVVIRTRLPPTPDNECHFKPQALPSVGTTDFLQSMMCDIQTECLSEDEVPKSNEPPVHGASIGLLLDDLDPLLADQSSLINDLESLPDTLGPLLNLTETLEDVFDLISEQNFLLGDFFMNQTRMKEMLMTHFEGAELDLIETLLDAHVNVLEVLDVIGYSDPSKLICNATFLESYVIFPPNTNVENIASALCTLTREDTENILEIILEELDVHYIAEEVNSFLRALDRYGLSNFTRDVLDIREQLENITALADFVDVLPDLIQLTRLIPDIQRFLEAVQGGNIDQTFYVLRSIIDNVDWEGSPLWWSNVQQILLDITDVAASIYDTVVDVKYGDIILEDVFRDVIGDVLDKYNISSDSLAGFLNSTIQESKIPDIISLLVNPEDTIEAYCNGEIRLEDFLTTEGAINASMLRNVLCKVGNGTSFLEALLRDFKARRSIPETMQFLSDLFQPIAPDLDLGSLINKTQEIIQEFDLLPDFLRDLPSMLTSLNVTQLAPLLDLATLFQNHSSIQEVLIQMLVEGTTVVEGLFTQYAFWPIIQEQLALQYVILDAQIAVVQRVLDGALVEAFKDDPFTQVGELFLELGPNITEAILSTFLDPTKIEELMSLPPEEQQLVLCSDFIEYPSGLDVTYAQEELCKLNLTELYPSHVEVWAAYFPEVAHAIEFSLLVFGGHNSSIPPEILGNATFKNIIYKQLEYQELLTSAFQMELDFKDFFAGLNDSIDVTGTLEEWNAMINRLTTNSLPALQQSVLVGEWESVLTYIEDIPEVRSFLALVSIEDIIIQDINIIVSLFNSLSRGEVPAYGGETEKLLHGVVFVTQQGNAIQAAILEAYQDPVKSLVLGGFDITQVLCNATLRDSLLDLTSVDIDTLDSSLCNLNYELLINETMELMQIKDLVNFGYYIINGWDDPIDVNLTAFAVHTSELVKTIGELEGSIQNWIELVVNGSDWLSLATQFTPEQWMRTWDTMFHMASFDNWTTLFEDLNPRNLTILIEDLLTSNLPGSEVYLHQIASMEVAVIQAMYGANNAFKLLDDLSKGYVSAELRGTEVLGIFEFILRVDLFQLNKVLSQPEVIGVVSQAGLPALFCNATVRDVILNLPGKGIDTSYFDSTICSMNYERAAYELYVFVNGPEVDRWLNLANNPQPDEYFKPSEIYLDSYTTVIEDFVNNLANVGELAQDLGEQFKIGEILVYYEKQWLTDMIGVNPTNKTDWDDLLFQQLTAVWEDLDKSLSEIPGWDQYRTNVYLILSAIEQITSMNATVGVQPFTLASIVPNVTEFIVILRDIPNLTDDIIYQLIYLPIDPVKLIELASTNSWNETLCNAELLSGIFINPAGVNLTQLQGALCAIDFESLIGQLSMGTGIEHLISMIIDQITSFNGGDDFGIGDYDPAQWASRIEQLIQSFDAQNIQGFIQSLANELMMVYEDIDSQLVNVTGWLEFKADLTILMSVLQYTTPFLGNGTNANGEAISLSMLVPNVTELEILLAQGTPLSPEIINTLINTAINPVTILELALSNDWNTTLCTEEGLMMLFVWPEGLNLTDIQDVLCSVDFKNTIMELMQEGAIESIIALIIDQFYLSIIPDFTLPGVDLTFLTDIIPPILSMIRTGDMQNIGEIFESLNSLSAMFANETWYQGTIQQLQLMDFITKTVTDKIIILEGQVITFPNLGTLLANSSELQRILLEDYQVGLGLVEALMTLSLQPDKLITFFNMTNPLLTLCATGQFSSFFYSPLNPDFNITNLEEVVCKLDAEQLVMEMKDLISLDDILEQIQVMASNNQTGSYNWTAGYLTNERLSLAITQLVQNPPKFTFDEVWVNKTLDTLLGLTDRWTKAQERLVGADLGSSFDGLTELLQQGVMANQSWAMEMTTALRTVDAVLDYTNDKLWALPGRNITLADLLPPDIASQIEASSDLTPDMIALLLGSYVNAGALVAVNSTWLDLFCSDPVMMFQVPPDVDLDAAQQALCSFDYEQWQLAYVQEIQNIFIEVESGREVNFTSITENFQRLAMGIQTLIEQPPTLLKYNEEWFESILQRTGAILKDTYNETQILDPNNLGMMLNQVWLEIAASNPSLLTPVRMNDYITQVLIDLLERLPGQTYIIPRLEQLFGNTTYVRALLSHSDIAPEIIDTFMILSVEQDKIEYLVNTPNVFVELCSSGQFSTFFQLPPDSPTDISLVEAAVCSTNLTLVLAELDEKFKFTEIISQIERILANDPTLPAFNKTAASLHTMEFSNLIAALIETPPQVTVDPVWWENVYNRSEVIVLQWLQRLTEQAMNGSSVPGLDTVIAQLRTLDIPGFDVDQLEMWIQQSQSIQNVIVQALTGTSVNGSATNETQGYILPILHELFPDPGLIRELLNLTGLPEDVSEIFLQTIPQLQKWLPMLISPDPLTAVCDGGFFQDIFLLTNTSIDIQALEDQICSLNLTDIDGVISQFFMSDFDALVLELLQMFYQVPGLDLQTALNVSREISIIISSLISDPGSFELNPQMIIELLQSLQVPGLNESWVQDWYKQVQLSQYINDVISNWIIMNNGTEFALPTFNELFPDPTIIVELLTNLGVPTDITAAFLEMAIQADQWTELWLQPDPLQAVCNSSLFQDIFTQTLNSSIDIQTIQDTLCSLNLSNIDAVLNDIFKTNPIIIQISMLLFNDPTMDWETAWNISMKFSQMFEDLFKNPPTTDQDIKQVILSVFNEVENMLRMYDVWDGTEHILKYTEVYLQFIQHHLGRSNNFLKDLFDPTVSLENLVGYVGLSPDEIKTALLGDITNLFLLADFYYLFGDWNYLFYCDDKAAFESIYNSSNNGFLDQFAVREAFCSLNISEFLESAKNLYGFDFLRLTELGYIRFRESNSSSFDVETLVDVASDIALMIKDLASLPSMLTQDLDLDFFTMRLANLTTAISAQEYEQLIVLLDELAPLLNSPDIVNQIRASLMSGTDIMSWFQSIDSTDPVLWLERIEGALNNTLLWHTILPALNFVDLLIEADVAALNPLGYKYYDLITNATVLQQYLVEILGLAPEYAETITLSGIKDLFVLAGHHLSGTWESTYCIAVDPADSTHFNMTAVFSLLCNLDRDQFFETASNLMGIDVLGLTQWIGEVKNPGIVTQRFDWQTLVNNVESSIGMSTDLSSIGKLGGANLTQVGILIQKLQQGIMQFDYEVLIEQMELLNQILYLDGQWDEVKGHMNSVTNIVEWLNMQLDNAHANNVSLGELITHHAMALQNLYYALGTELFPQLVTALVEPEQAMTLQTHNEIEVAVCDKDSFNGLLQPTIYMYHDTNSLQGSLCELLQSGHPTIANDLMTHFNIAPVEHEINVIATKNFPDEDLDMRNMIYQFEKLSNTLISNTFNGFMHNGSLNASMLPNLDMNTDDVIMMIGGALVSSLPAIPYWNEYIYPILGRLDLAMTMVQDLFFSLPGREAEIQAVLDDATIVNNATPVILMEVPKIITAWNQVMQQPAQIPMLSKFLLELLTGSLEGISEDPSSLIDMLAPANFTSETPTAMIDILVSLDRILLTEFAQQLMDVFRIRENAARLSIIFNYPDPNNLEPFDAYFIGRTEMFIVNAMHCSKSPSECIIELQAPATLELLIKLGEVASQLPAGSLESLGDVFSAVAPILQEFIRQTGNRTSNLEKTLNTTLSFLMTVFEANKVSLIDVLSIFDLEEALLNSSSVYQFLRDNTDLTELDFMAIKNGSINITVLFELLDLGTEDSINLLCHEALINDLFINLDPNVTAEIVKGVCSNGTFIAVEFLRTNLDLRTIIELIQNKGETTFPDFILETLTAIGEVPYVDYEALGDFITIVAPALFKNGIPKISDLDTLAEHMNITRRALQSIDALMSAGEYLFRSFPQYGDVQQLVRTLLDNLYIIELIAEFPDLSVRNILEDEIVLEDYLAENTAMTRREARDIVYSTFDLEELFVTDLAGYLAMLCDPEYLSTILIFPNQTNATIIADTMCSLSGDDIATVLDTLLPFVHVGAIVNVSYMADNFGDAFSISNATIIQAMQSIASLEAVTMALPSLQDALSNFNDDPAVEKLREIAELGFYSGEEVSAITQEIVCGSTSLRKRRDADENKKIQRYKRSAVSDNSNDFCQDIFSSIVEGVDGRLVWAYLKPIVEGRILFSPDIPAVRRIIEKANKTFEDITMTQRFADIWLTSGEDLGTVLDPDTLDATMSLLENSYVQGLLEDQYGISTDDFTDILNGNLTSMDPGQLQTLNLLAELVSNLTRCFNLNRFEGYRNEDDMVQAARNLDEDNTLLAAVAFDIPSDATELPAHIKYKIRMDTDNTPPTDRQKNRFLSRSSSTSFVFDLRYLRGYIMLQDMIEGSIVSLQASPDLQPPGVYLQMTPYPCFLKDDFTDIFTLVLPLVMTISFVVLIGVMTYQLVYEKERGIEELMKVMGLPGGANWWAWFISNSLILILLSAVVTLILKFGNVLPSIDWSLLLVFILDYFFSLIMFCYLASAVFQRASIASLASILVYSLFYLPYLAVFASESLLDTLWKPIVLSIFFPSTFSIGCVLMSQFEGMGVGAQWEQIWINPVEEEVTSMGFILIALAVDGAIYLVLGWYIRTLFPGKYGVPRSWYFPLQPSFWCNCSISKKRDMTQYINSAYDPESGVSLTDQGPVVEEEPSNHPLGLAILNLTKIYRSCFKQEKVAVDNLTLNFFEGQVTALLGHNGAGKTTTINIITGLFPATSGKVYLHGLNVAKQATVTRENLGVCVQHNALYDNLTVREHMALTGRVKGITGKELDNDIYNLLEDVGLLKKSEEQIKNLSGGMKRKLSVAMAFVGHSTIVILDEPTSGVDPHARRAIWNLIMKNKTGRTIVLCTHFMDEADILGDRIAILDRGHLRCCGSPAFLKSRFSSGYRLSLTKEASSGVSTPTNQADHRGMAVPNIYDTMKSANSDVPSTSSGIATDPGSSCDSSLVTDFIQARISTARLQDDIGSELVYVLPVDHGEREQFQELFEDLDNNLADLRIKSYGISDTTLKEVFLKVSTSRSVAGETAILKNNNWTMRKPGETFTIAEGVRRENSYQPNGHFTPRVLLNAWGIFVKRLHFVRRDWQGFIWTILMPVLMVALAVGFSQLSQINREYPRQLTPAMFNPNSYAFFSDESESDMGQRLTDALINPPGLGTTCMADADQIDLYPCIDANSESDIELLARLNLSSLSAVPEGQCKCTDTGFGQECTPEAGGIPPPAWLTDSQIILQNITIKEDKDRYLIDTQQKFRNSRYGGVSWFDVAGSNETQAKAWYNNRAYHAMPTYLNVMNNIILRATVNNNSEQYGITAYNHPLQLSKQDLGINIWLDAAKTFGIALVIVIALVLIPSSFSMFLVTENINGSKRLHHVSGMGTITYWLTNLIWDMLSFCIPVGLMLVVLYIFNFRALILASNIGAFVTLVFLYGFAVMSQIYIFLSFFKEVGSAFIFFFCILLLESVITNLPNWLMAVNVVPESEKPTFEILNYVLLVFSPYCLSSGLLALIQNQATADIYRAFGMEDGIYQEPFGILKWHMIALAVEGAVAFIVLLIVDAIRNSKSNSCLDPNVNEPPSYNDNDDVMAEKEMVLGGGGSNDAVILKELKKVYRGPGGQKIVAVSDLCLGISKGECFGLLGVNGAGKTSTFRMITGDLAPTDGSVKMKAKSVGYCPQENAMYPQLTGEELLYCYARMKGIQSSDMKKAVSEVCEELGMERYLGRRISSYSGGMKRSLAVAVALLGKPELILMDEPTTGMDPITKQKVLASIVNVIRDNRSVILTSHSMEECEAVCTRLAIMVNGQFCCLGSPQHVKNRHGEGYSLVVRGQKTGKSDMSLITEFVHSSFPGAEIKEHHHNLVRFQLPPHNITVATIFGIMEREKTALNLEDYSVSQTTLDEVFVNFAKKQTDGLEDDTSSTTSAQEVSIVNRAFEPEDDLDVDIFPRNSKSLGTQF